VRALIVGHGHMGRFHARVLRDLGYTVTTVDPIAQADLAELPRDLGTYDVAAIATPPELLGLYGIACADAGLRTLIEKPFARSLDEAETTAGHQTDWWRACVGFIERFNPQVRRLRERLPAIGRPVQATFTRWSDRPSCDLLTDLRIHDVDLAHWLALDCPIAYDTRASTTKRRTIAVHGTRGKITVDLMAHTQSPLHVLWHAFLTGQQVPTLEDAVRAHRALHVDAEAIAA
jgi:predicted dehydrogenase